MKDNVNQAFEDACRDVENDPSFNLRRDTKMSDREDTIIDVNASGVPLRMRYPATFKCNKCGHTEKGTPDVVGIHFKIKGVTPVTFCLRCWYESLVQAGCGIMIYKG